MQHLPPGSTRTDTLFPNTPLVRSPSVGLASRSAGAKCLGVASPVSCGAKPTGPLVLFRPPARCLMSDGAKSRSRGAKACARICAASSWREAKPAVKSGWTSALRASDIIVFAPAEHDRAVLGERARDQIGRAHV